MKRTPYECRRKKWSHIVKEVRMETSYPFRLKYCICTLVERSSQVPAQVRHDAGPLEGSGQRKNPPLPRVVLRHALPWPELEDFRQCTCFRPVPQGPQMLRSKIFFFKLQFTFRFIFSTTVVIYGLLFHNEMAHFLENVKLLSRLRLRVVFEYQQTELKGTVSTDIGL